MIAVMGDIHGCYFTLTELFQEIKNKYPDIQVYAVGDLVDRGNKSYEVVEFIIDNKILFTPGNHDYMFYYFFKKPSSVFARSWVFNGSEATLKSYDDHDDKLFEHLEILKKAPLYFDTPDCFITHAGITKEYEDILDPSFKNDFTPLYELINKDFSSDRGVLWLRGKALNIGKLQIMGHTKHQEITLDEEANAIYIDTGAYVGNKLSAVIVDNEQIVDVIDVKTHLNDII